MQRRNPGGRRPGGFALFELGVVIVLIGVAASLGVPRFLKSVEKARAAEAFDYLTAVQKAQEQYLAHEGRYADDVVYLDLDFDCDPPQYFDLGTITPGSTGSLESSWRLIATRSGGSAETSPYTVVFTEQGLDPSSTIGGALRPVKR